MALSLEQIDSQSKRRGVSIPQDDNFNSNQKKPNLSIEKIDSILKKRGVALPEEQNTTPDNERGFKGVGKDIIGLAKGLPHAIGKFLETSSELPALGKQVVSFPYDVAKSAMHGEVPRLTKNVLTGANEVANWPSAIASYLGKKDFISPRIGKALEVSQRDFGLGKPQEGDTLAQMLLGMAIPLKIPGMIKKSKELSKADQIAKAEAEHASAMGYENTLNEEMAKKLKTTNPLTAKGKIYENESALEKTLTERNAIPKENLSNRLPAPEGNDIVPAAERAIKDWENKVRHTLQEGETHSENFAQRLTHHISGTKNALGEREGGLAQELGSKYESLKDEVKQQPDISYKEPINIASIEKSFDRKITPGTLTPEARQLILDKLIAAAEKTAPNKKIPAIEFYNKYRTLKKEAENATSNAYQRGISPEAHDQWIEIGKAKKQEYLKMEKILETQLQGDIVHKLKKLNNRYATEYAPTFENKFYQKLLAEGKLSSYDADLFNKLSGTGKGQDILRKFVLEDPELIHSMFGHQFAGSPQRLIHPDVRKNQYLQNPHPMVSNILNLHNEGVNLHNELPKAREKAALVIEESNRVKAASKEAIEKQERRLRLEDEIAKHQKEIAEAEELLQKKEEASKNTKIKKEQLDELIKAITKNSSKIQKVTGFAGKIAKGTGTISLAKNLKDLISELLD